ncbi:hypothetical protein N9L68_04565 [bacterium]|nr:hypothetical protein [bacterium]
MACCHLAYPVCPSRFRHPRNGRTPPAGATPDKAPQASGVRQEAEAEQPKQSGGVRQVEQTPRARYGTQLTFAGRRPPKGPKRRQLFDDLRMEYYRQKEQYRKAGWRTGCIYSDHKYNQFMKLNMQTTITITNIIIQNIIVTIMIVTITRTCGALASQALK